VQGGYGGSGGGYGGYVDPSSCGNVTGGYYGQGACVGGTRYGAGAAAHGGTVHTSLGQSTGCYKTGGGGGGFGGGGGAWTGLGGGGGGLGWKNNISVTPGNTYTVVVGVGGYPNYSTCNSGCGSVRTAAGGGGAVRIVWPGCSRRFPSTCVGTP
jgi:hypothetical protein